MSSLRVVMASTALQRLRLIQITYFVNLGGARSPVLQYLKWP
jgi:hypothetical protein